jgi:eukaryotic-like serine/threonine-protein kinase
MTPSSNPGLPAGRKLGGGRYQIVKKLGEGGYGSVYLANDLRLSGRKVAVKELCDQSAAAQQLFQREATLLATLDHPGLVRVSDFFDDGRCHYLVMDYIEGRDLLEVVLEADKHRRMLPVDQVTDWLLQVCDAVTYLHQRQLPIIHRDIKPANIRLKTNQQAILVDFGIAKIDPKTKTHLMAKAVSQGFSPPEQYSGGGGTDTRSDVYALGATLYCLLTAQRPTDSFERHVENKPLPPPRQFNRAINPALENVILKAMALNSAQRYQDGGELAAALRAALGRSAAAQLFVAPPASAPSAAASPAPSSSMICSHCGQVCRTGARFCPKCGQSFEGPALRCPACNALVRRGARFCARCRAPLHDLSQANQYQAQGDLALRAHQFDRAVEDYERARQLGADTPTMHINLGRCYTQLDRFDDAIVLLEDGVRQHPTEAALHTQLALAYLGSENFAQGLRSMERAYQLAPDNDDLAQLLTELYFDLGQYTTALPILEQLRRRAPQQRDVRLRLAIGYLMADRLAEAEKLIKELQREDPDDSELAVLLGLLHRKRGNTRQALKDLQAAVRRLPNHALAYELLGDIYFEQKKIKEAIAAFEKSALANPRDGDPHVKLGRCYMAQGKTSEAEAALGRALRIDPNNALAQKILAELNG